MSMAISEISHVFNAHFKGVHDKSDNLSQYNSARTTSNNCVVSNSINQGEAEDEDSAAPKNADIIFKG